MFLHAHFHLILVKMYATHLINLEGGGGGGTPPGSNPDTQYYIDESVCFLSEALVLFRELVPYTVCLPQDSKTVRWNSVAFEEEIQTRYSDFFQIKESNSDTQALLLMFMFETT